ncbi:MAG TPA: GNAT family protein [Pyrinomonadaceae bacterium]|nr:GNAT family protein [Pyrinomonadaceae bacterium]
MAYGWEGEKVRLVPLDKERHLSNVVLWMNDPDVTETLLSGDVPLTRLAEEDFFDRMTAPAGQHPTDIIFAIETLAGEHVGTCGIHNINYRHGTGLTGTIIGAAEARGKGYGTDAAIVRTRYAFEVLGLRMLISEVFTDNAASLKILSRAGYREVARLPRRYWKRGAFRDVVLLVAERPS